MPEFLEPLLVEPYKEGDSWFRGSMFGMPAGQSRTHEAPRSFASIRDSGVEMGVCITTDIITGLPPTKKGNDDQGRIQCNRL